MELTHMGTIGAHCMNLKVDVTLCLKHNVVFIGRPTAMDIWGGRMGQTSLVATICTHDVYLIVSVTVGYEKDHCSIRRPGGAYVVGVVRCQAFQTTPVGIDDVDLCPVRCPHSK
jgi:hypothetical protein